MECRAALCADDPEEENVMIEPNPYQPPGSPVAAAAIATPDRPVTVTANTVEAGRGWTWIVEGFELFKKAPGTWILILVVFFVCAVVIHIVPIIGSLAGALLTQVFVGGMMIGCRALANGEPLELGHLFAGFKHKTGDLVMLGVLALVGWILCFIPAIAIVGGGAFMSMLMGGNPAALFGAMGLSVVLAMLVVLLLAVPLYMALWFAPALVALDGLKPVDAMKASFMGCLKNIVPFFIYGIIMLVLCIVASIPMFLGFLVLGPVAVASMYAGYRDIFTSA
jgi:hypothetical protein